MCQNGKYDFTERTERLIGSEGVDKLHNAAVLLFGLGGVGSYCAEALARAGIGRIGIVDSDVVTVSNINRQLIALHSNIGRNKTDVCAERLLDINPNIVIDKYTMFYNEENGTMLDFAPYSYVVDAIDSVSSKVAIIERAKKCGIPVLSCMGTGNRIDPMKFRVTDIFDTKGDALARVMRKRLRQSGIDSVRVLISDAETVNVMPTYDEDNGKIIASVSFVPSVAGLMAAGTVINDILAMPRLQS